MKEKLNEWAKKVSGNKKKIDKEMFDELVETTIRRFEKYGYKETFDWLQDNYDKGINHRMVGPHLMATNSKQIKDKLWSLNRKNKS